MEVPGRASISGLRRAQERNEAVGLAHDAYCGRRDAGETLDPDAYCEQFPAIRSALRAVIHLHHNTSPDKLEEWAPAEVFNNLGWAYLQSAQLEQARQNFDEAIRRNPRFQAAFYNRAQCHLQKAHLRGEYDLGAGLADIEEANRLGPHNGKLFHLAASLHVLAGKVKKDRHSP
jgi:tetratricopeptide (TPR) repeat protein